MAHLIGADVEPEARAVAVVMRAPMQHPAPVGPFPVVELGIDGALATSTRRQQWRGAFGIGTAGQVLHAARSEQHGKRQRLTRNVGNLCRRERQAAFSREFSGRPHEARKRLVIENAGEHVREQRLPSDFAVTDGLEQCVARLARPILQVGEHLQRAFGGESKIVMARESRDCRIQVATMDFEGALLQIGVADVSVNRREPVERPAFWRRDARAPARRSGTHSSPLKFSPSADGSSPAVPTSAPRRSVTRARAAGALSAATVMRAKFLRPSGC